MSDSTLIRAGLGEQVYERLRAQIFDFKYEPGVMLVINRLTEEFGVSTTPVREALNRLAAERLIRFKPYVGFTVRARPAAEELRQSFEARLAIEGFASRLSSAHHSEDTVIALRQIEEEIESQQYGERASDFVSFISNNRKFHETIVRCSGNEFLLEAWQNLHHDDLVGLVLYGRGVPDIADIRREHRDIVEAFAANNVELTYDAVRRHIGDGCSRILDAVGKWEVGSNSDAI
jgi:DNA-binding GntR family transcriptional regulator